MDSIRVFSAFGPELESVWRRLEAECDHFAFQCYDWVSHWHATVGVGAHPVEPCVVVAWSAGEPVALWPLARRRSLGVRTIEFLGGGQADYNAPIVRHSHYAPELLGALWARALAALPPHDIRAFTRMPADLPGGPNPILAIWPGRASQRSWAATLPSDWNAYLERIPRKVRNDSKRQMARVAALGEVRFAVAETRAEFEEIADVMIAQKRRRYRETGVRDALADPGTRAFYRSGPRRLGEHGAVHLSAMRVNGDVVAAHWGAVYGDRFYYLVPTYADGTWRKLSVGRLLQEWLMQQAVERGLRCFDFSVGDEDYKRVWCDRETALVESAAVVTARGRASHAVTRGISWVKTTPVTRRALMAIVRRARPPRG